MDEAADDSLILLLVDRGGILGVFEEVHGCCGSPRGEGRPCISRGTSGNGLRMNVDMANFLC
jgi:hypothetical protein